MSITRLQQARQMYAMGQRVGRAFGGVMGPDGRKAYVGGSYSDKGGYQGGGDRKEDGGSGGKAGGAGTGTDGQGGTGGGASEINSPQAPVMSNIPMDIKEQVRLGNPVSKIGTVVYDAPDFSKVGPGSTQYDNYIDRLNLQGATYKPVNLPSFIPGGMLINTVGNFLGGIGFNKNKQFFADNVAGKYGFGYGLEDYQRYMKDRMAGEVGAYGNKEQGQNALSGQGGGGIMDVAVSDTTDDTTDDTNTDGSLILRFLHDNPQEVVNLQAMGVRDTDEMLQVMLDRAKNLYTT